MNKRILWLTYLVVLTLASCLGAGVAHSLIQKAVVAAEARDYDRGPQLREAFKSWCPVASIYEEAVHDTWWGSLGPGRGIHANLILLNALTYLLVSAVVFAHLPILGSCLSRTKQPTRPRFPYIVGSLCAASLLAGAWLLVTHVRAVPVTSSALAKGPEASPKLVDKLVRIRFDDFQSAHTHLDLGYARIILYDWESSGDPPDGPFYVRTDSGLDQKLYGKSCWIYGIATASGPSFEIQTGFAQTLDVYRTHLMWLTVVFAGAFTAAYLRWVLLRGRFSRSHVDARIAAEVLFCLEAIETLQTTQPEYTWLWEIRSQVLRFFAKRYDLRDVAEGYHLNDDEKRRITRTESLLRPPKSITPGFESREVAKLRKQLRRKLRRMQLFAAADRVRS